jgi:biotin carboxyl carrier protein
VTLPDETRTLAVHAEPLEGGGWRLVAPRVGFWLEPPAAGTLVGPGSGLGRLRTLNRVRGLVVPEGVAGSLEGPPRDRRVAVEHGTELARVRPLATGAVADLGTLLPGGEAAPAGLGAGLHGVTAPTDGVFWLRPGPGEPPFVEPRATLVLGQAVGLIEVMKTFNQVRYGGAGLPERAELVELRCSDGAEVRSGQLLMVVRASGSSADPTGDPDAGTPSSGRPRKA